MFIGKQAALLAGASPILFGRAPERKDGTLTNEVKEAVDALGKVFEEFKAKNDTRLAQLDRKGEDAVTKDEVEKLNKGIDDAKTDLKKRIDELEAKANRLQLGTSATGAVEAKAIAAFAEMTGKKDATAEDLAEYKGNLDHFLRTNQVKAQTMMVAQDPSGGFWVTPDTGGRMVSKLYESTPMRQLANVVSIGTDRLEGPIDNGAAVAQWVGEVDTRSQTDAPQVGMWAIDVNELYAYPMVTQKLLEDAKIDVEEWIANKAASQFARSEATAFVSGDGNKKPKGFLSYTAVATDDLTRPWGQLQYVPSGAAGAFQAGSSSVSPADPLVDLIFSVKAGYRQGSSFMMARKTMAAVRKLKDGQGNYLVDLRLRDGALVESIFGFPNVDGEDMPPIAANSLSIAFGNFAEAYMILDRLGVSAVRDNVTKPGFVKFLMRKRVGGGLVNSEALKLLKFAAN